MKLSLKHFVAIVIIATLAVSCVILASCSLFDKSIHISTFEDLQQAHGGKLVLDNDIDGNYASINPIVANRLDGNGHTISNFVVSTTTTGGIFTTNSCLLASVKNVTFENVTVNTTSAYRVGLIVEYAQSDLVIENVHVKDCKIVAEQGSKSDDLFVGGLVGSCNGNPKNSPVNESQSYSNLEVYRNKFDIINCSVDGLDVKVTGKSNASKDIYFGGIASVVTRDVTGCAVSNCNFTVESQSPSNELYIGGIASYVCTTGSIEGCYVENTTFNANAKWYNEGTFGYRITSKVTLGGLFAKSEGVISGQKGSSVKACYSANNTLNVSSTGAYCVGGISGRSNSAISHCYSSNNTIACKGRLKADNERAMRYAGGVTGYAVGATSYLSCYAYGNIISDADGVSLQSKECRQGGFLGGAESTVMTNYCAVGNTKFEASGAKKDGFCNSSIKATTSTCYVSQETFSYDVNSTNVCTYVDEEVLFDFSTIGTTLNLTDSRWVKSADKLPYLQLN